MVELHSICLNKMERWHPILKKNLSTCLFYEWSLDKREKVGESGKKNPGIWFLLAGVTFFLSSPFVWIQFQFSASHSWQLKFSPCQAHHFKKNEIKKSKNINEKVNKKILTRCTNSDHRMSAEKSLLHLKCCNILFSLKTKKKKKKKKKKKRVNDKKERKEDRKNKPTRKRRWACWKWQLQIFVNFSLFFLFFLFFFFFFSFFFFFFTCKDWDAFLRSPDENPSSPSRSQSTSKNFSLCSSSFSSSSPSPSSSLSSLCSSSFSSSSSNHSSNSSSFAFAFFFAWVVLGTTFFFAWVVLGATFFFTWVVWVKKRRKKRKEKKEKKRKEKKRKEKKRKKRKEKKRKEKKRKENHFFVVLVLELAQNHQSHLFSCFPLRSRDFLLSWGDSNWLVSTFRRLLGWAVFRWSRSPFSIFWDPVKWGCEFRDWKRKQTRKYMMSKPKTTPDVYFWDSN